MRDIKGYHSAFQEVMLREWVLKEMPRLTTGRGHLQIAVHSLFP